MKVGFLHVGADDRLARLMVKSGRRLGYDFLMMTDDKTPAIEGCDVVRLPWDGQRLMTYRLQHLAGLSEPMMICDTDVIHLADCSDIWLQPFDLALTRRGETIDPNGFDISTVMPYNIGVMFGRNPAAWRAAYDYCASLPDSEQAWYGDQLAMAHVASAFDTLDLPAEQWNCTPGAPDECPPARVLHYKGARKKWMLHIWPALLDGQ